MSFNFATEGYRGCFGSLPEADGAQLRAKTAEYMKSFDPSSWSTNPITTLLNGTPLTGGTTEDTVDAFNRVNGKITLATAAEVDQVIAHIKGYQPPSTDLRPAIRAIDLEFCDAGKLAPTIIGNQAIDFQKQDGITEIEESIQANLVEQRINDELLKASAAGQVTIRSKQLVFVGCVSNFSNFLDLFRKVLRHIEMGVPVVVLSRSNTTQHMFRWTVILLEKLKEKGVDLGMVSYLACSIPEQRRVFAACPDCPMHFTGSRQVAEKIKEVVPKLFASTGGPNTLVSTQWNDQVGDAVRWSNLIENKGQCTALRHCVCPNLTVDQLDASYSKAPLIQNSLESIEKSEFAGIFQPQGTINSETASTAASEGSDGEQNYSKLASQPLMNVRISADLPVKITEHWRQLYLDVTTPAVVNDASFLTALAQWLNREQPISLAVNDSSFDVALKLFQMTGMVVYTVGTLEKPALTAQARPQDGEVFGEFPPRKEMLKYSHAPMVVPSAVAAYNSVYTEEYLVTKSAEAGGLAISETGKAVVAAIEDPKMKGYAVVLAEYLLDACKEPGKVGFGARTTLFGLQRCPIDYSGGTDEAFTKTVLLCDGNLDALLLYTLPFVMTTAAAQVQIEPPAKLKKSGEKKAQLEKVLALDIACVERDEVDPTAVFNVVTVDALFETAGGTPDFMLAQQFISRLFPLGHIKSTASNDTAFLEAFRASPKWLRIA